MLERFQEHLATSGLIPPGSKVLVGYSGGADSTALLHLLHLSGLEVVAAHLHHGQRPEGEDELNRCQQFAESLGIPFMAGRADVPKISRDLGMSLEQAGREARYEFFREGAFGMNCSLIATAHTLTDHVETVILNLTRGTGLSGLAGIPEQRQNIVRPILPFTREDTSRYCEAHGLWTHDDPANFDLDFSRSRIRLNVLPELRQVNPSVEAAVQRLASIAGQEDEFLNGMAAAALERLEIALNGELRFLTDDVELRFDRAGLSHLPEVLRARAVRLAAEAMGGPLSFEQTRAVFNGLESTETGSVTADGGTVTVSWNETHLDIRQLLPSSPYRFNLTIPGETLSEEFGWQFTAYEEPYLGGDIVRASLQTTFDRATVRGLLYFRTLNVGDTMQPLGFDRRRKLSDILSDAKLTPAARTRLPIVCDMLGPIWAPGVCVDDRVRPTTSTERSIQIRFGTLRP